jgi:hypothetical protein
VGEPDSEVRVFSERSNDAQNGSRLRVPGYPAATYCESGTLYGKGLQGSPDLRRQGELNNETANCHTECLREELASVMKTVDVRIATPMESLTYSQESHARQILAD